MLSWLSRLFRRPQKPGTFHPRNHLERLLMKAADDPAIRPEFSRALMDSRVCVIGWVADHAPAEEEAFVSQAGDTMNVQHISYEGREVIPIFTSPERIAEYAPGTTYLAMTLRNLLETTGPQELFMNPGSAYGKHFTSSELQGLLDGSAFQPRETWVAQKQEEFLIGRPAKYPDRFVEALKTMFSRRNDVRRAYLALICIPSRSEIPNLYLAIDADTDLTAIAADCGMIAADTLDKGEFVDIGSTSLAPDYFATDTPIYNRD